MQNRQRAPAAFVAGLLLACLFVAADCAAVHNRRAVAETSPSENLSLVKTCHSSTPCGWAVYVPFTRRIDYFMKNTCDCPQGKICLRADDDLSVSAYVYRCQVYTPDDEEDPQGS